MKKFILPLLAIAGMVLGFSLTSCGGGGSSENPNVGGTIIVVNGPQSVYRLHIGDRYSGTGGAYTGLIQDEKGTRVSDVMFSLTDVQVNEKRELQYCKATVSPVSLDNSSRQALFLIVLGLDITDSKIVSLEMSSTPMFVFDGRNPAHRTVTWDATAEYDYALGDVLDEDISKETARTDNVLDVERD